MVTCLISQAFATFINMTHFESDVFNNNILNIEKYTIAIPEEFNEYTKGFIPGLGSSITFKKNINSGHIQLYALCDRGPNYTISADKPHKSTIIFPEPTFSPFIGVIDIIKGKSANLTKVVTIKWNNELATGIPTPIGQHKDNSLPIPADLNFNSISAMGIIGVDPESLDIDGDGNFWIGDEYGPSIIKTNRKGEIINILSPEIGLPKILENGPVNRGFEALAVAPNGKIYAVMESILDFNGQTKDTANFIRMVEIDPITNKTRMFAYSFDKNVYRNNLSVKIGDLVAIDDTHFLIIEQGMTDSGMRNIIYCIDISDATNISNIRLPKEKITLRSMVQTIKKTKLLDIREYNWPFEKLEGIALLSDDSIAITNDNDFGFSLSINGVNTQDVEGYTVDLNAQKLLRNGKETEDKIEVNIDKEAHTALWIVKFQKPILEIVGNKASPKSKLNSLNSFDTKLEKTIPLKLINPQSAK